MPPCALPSVIREQNLSQASPIFKYRQSGIKLQGRDQATREPRDQQAGELVARLASWYQGPLGHCSSGLYGREFADGLFHLLPRIRVILQPTGQEILVGPEIEVPMPAEVEEDHARPAVALGLERFVDGLADGMR